MSRAYRIRVRESTRRIIRSEDHVSTTLELLAILPRESMAELLRAELLGRGFEAEGNLLIRRDGGVSITVDPAAGEVTVRAESVEEVELAAERGGVADTDWGADGRERAREALRKELQDDLEAQAQQRSTDASRRATERLEAALGDLRSELDQVVNRVTAEALKRKAAQLGQIKEMTEDVEAGSLTIVLEV